MADYWKSQPRKFCQYCKCWIADNKPSVEFHERGKNHKENVTAKIEEIKKKSVAKAKQEEKMSKEFAAMEAAALKAYEEDLKRLTEGENYIAPVAPAKPQKNVKHAPAKPKNRGVKFPPQSRGISKQMDGKQADVWVEGTTDDGQIYYYNTITGESQWEKPGMVQGTSPSSSSSSSGQIQGSSGSAWMEAVSPDGYTYYYNTETGESSWEKPNDLNLEAGSSQEETQEEPAPPVGEEDTSESPKETTEAEPAETTQTKVPKISFRKRKEEPTPKSEDDEEQKTSDEEQKTSDGGENVEKKEEDTCVPEASPAVKVEVTPAKRARKMNPYGNWEQIQPEEDPYEKVDLQLPQVEAAAPAVTAPAAPAVPSEPRAKFKERTITSLGDEGNAEATFKKRKTENGKSRSLRQRGKDD